MVILVTLLSCLSERVPYVTVLLLLSSREEQKIEVFIPTVEISLLRMFASRDERDYGILTERLIGLQSTAETTRSPFIF